MHTKLSNDVSKSMIPLSPSQLLWRASKVPPKALVHALICPSNTVADKINDLWHSPTGAMRKSSL